MAQHVEPTGVERSLGDLFAQLSRETATLVQQEVGLARAELRGSASRLGKDLGYLVVGGAVLYAGVLVLLATVIIALAYALPWWLSAFLVALAVLLAGSLLVQRGLQALKREQFAPQQTIQTLQEDAKWLKEQTR